MGVDQGVVPNMKGFRRGFIRMESWCCLGLFPEGLFVEVTGTQSRNSDRCHG